ncbi:MAG: hypothetical protein IV107_24170 [Paucibacter sp.]|nr:hypothetical protein [Roseateles sp.]
MNKAKALTAYLAGRQPAPFDWHTNNCGHFACSFVQQVEGFDPLASLPLTDSMAGTRAFIAEAGGMAELVTRQLAREPISPKLAQLGDMVLLPLSTTDPEALALGLCCGEQAVILTDTGVHAFVPMSAAVSAWRVGA